MILGYIGLTLLVVAYATLLTKHSKLFLPIDIVASLLLTLYAISISDLIFTIVNGLITIILVVTYIKGEVEI